MIIINDDQRRFLKRPFSEPVKNIDKKALEKMNCKFIVVGDYSTQFFVENGIEFDVCVVDYKTERRDISEQSKKVINTTMKNRKVLKIHNPKGVVSDEAISMVREWVEHGDKMFVIVEGEDDLVALPFFAYAPEDYCVVYGIKNKGMVVKKVSAPFKEEIMQRFKGLMS